MHDPQHDQSSSHAQGLEAKEIPSPSGGGRKMSLDFSSYRSGFFGSCQSCEKLATRGRINSDLPVLFRPQVQALGGQLFYSDRHMVLPVETSGRLGMA